MTAKIWSTWQHAVFAFAAATASDRILNLVVSAFAGTGKTTTMVEYVNRLPEGESVALFAFGNKNARDLREKVTRPGAEVLTFNAAGARLVRMYMKPRGEPDTHREAKLAAKLLGITAPLDMVTLVGKLAAKGKGALPGFEAMDRMVETRRAQLAAEGTRAKAHGDLSLADKLRAEWKQAQATVWASNEGRNVRQSEMEALAEEHDLVPDPMWAAAGWTLPRIAKAALDVMELSRTAHTKPMNDPLYDNTISFDDQVYLPVVNNWVFPAYDNVIVDECQDTNPVGLRFARRVLKAGGRFGVVGDRNQALFAFRGADVRSMDKIKEEMSQPGKGGVVELSLPETYRCAKAIVRDAQRFVPGYVAHPSNPEGEVKRIPYRDVVASVGPGDFVLSRTNAPLTKVCVKLLLAGKRAKVEGKKVGENLLKLVEKVGGKAKSIPEFLERVTAWEERETERIKAGAKNVDAAQAKLDRVEDDAECLRAMTEGVKGLTELRKRISDLFTDDASADAQVVCMTVHKSKGLETDRVFVLEDTLAIKVSKKVAKLDTAEKAARRAETERCIRFVAATRPKNTLVYVQGLEDTPAPRDTRHEVAVAAAAKVTGETVEQWAEVVRNIKQLMEKDNSDSLRDALESAEAQLAKLTQARA